MIIFHIDANSAYLSWEAVRRLEAGASLDLRSVPSVVGGDPRKRSGIVLTKSIPAKKFGIQTGETLWEARSKCPDLIIVPPDYDLYLRCSDAMYDILRRYSSRVQRYSVDECFLDYTHSQRALGDALEAARDIKERISRELGFTVNVGVSVNKLLAKMASELQKPDRLHTLFPGEIPEKMWPLPVEELFMVGRATTRKLHRINVRTIGQLAAMDPVRLEGMFKSHGRLIHRYANGLDDSRVLEDAVLAPKSIGNSTTTAWDLTETREARLVLLALTERVAMRLRRARCLCSVVTVSVRNSILCRYSHQRVLDTPTDVTGELFSAVTELFDQCWQLDPIRHLGVRLSGLEGNDFVQLSLLDDPDRLSRQRLDVAVDQLRQRYGDGALIRGCFVQSGVRPVLGGVNDGDYPMMTSLL